MALEFQLGVQAQGDGARYRRPGPGLCRRPGDADASLPRGSPDAAGTCRGGGRRRRSKRCSERIERLVVGERQRGKTWPGKESDNHLVCDYVPCKHGGEASARER